MSQGEKRWCFHTQACGDSDAGTGIGMLAMGTAPGDKDGGTRQMSKELGRCLGALQVLEFVEQQPRSTRMSRDTWISTSKSTLLP